MHSSKTTPRARWNHWLRTKATSPDLGAIVVTQDEAESLSRIRNQRTPTFIFRRVIEPQPTTVLPDGSEVRWDVDVDGSPSYLATCLLARMKHRRCSPRSWGFCPFLYLADDGKSPAFLSLSVRESVATVEYLDDGHPPIWRTNVCYLADHPKVARMSCNTNRRRAQRNAVLLSETRLPHNSQVTYKPAIFVGSEEVRTWLRVTNVRVEEHTNRDVAMDTDLPASTLFWTWVVTADVLKHCPPSTEQQ